MKKMIMSTLLATAVVAAFAAPSVAKAAPVSTEKTDLGISFSTDEPNKEGQGPFKDNLAIAWTPTAFEFGQQKTVGGIATYNNTRAGNQYIIVNDDRDAEKSKGGWKLTAGLSEMTATNDATVKINAVLKFDLTAVQRYNIGTEIDPDTNDYKLPKPDAAGALVDFKAGEADIFTLGNAGATTVSLEAGAATTQDIMAKAPATAFKSGVSSQIKNTKLVVTDSQGTKAGGKTFASQLTWTLDDLK